MFSQRNTFWCRTTRPRGGLRPDGAVSRPLPFVPLLCWSASGALSDRALVHLLERRGVLASNRGASNGPRCARPTPPCCRAVGMIRMSEAPGRCRAGAPSVRCGGVCAGMAIGHRSPLSTSKPPTSCGRHGMGRGSDSVGSAGRAGAPAIPAEHRADEDRAASTPLPARVW
jgi:hypothetical protein